MLVLIFRFPLPRFLPVVILGSHYSTPLHSAPLEPLAPLDSSYLHGSASEPNSDPDSNPESDPDSKTVTASAALFFAPYKSMSACYHHHQYTLAPVRLLDRSQRSRIGCIAIYCAAAFCLVVTDFLIPSKPASPSASSTGG